MLNDLSSVANTLIFGGLAYLVIIALLRVSGKRTLSKWNAFDFVSTIAYGSILATIVLRAETSLVQGIIGIGILLLLQFGLTWLAVRSHTLQRLIKAKPRLLLLNGQFIQNALVQERITESEVRAAVRGQGMSSMDAVEAIVLETDGSFSIIESINPRSDSALCDVIGYRSAAYES